MFKIEGMFKNLFKKIVFFAVFWLSSRVKEGIWSQNGKMVGVLTIQGQNSQNSPSEPWEIEHFSVLSLLFHLSLPKIWQARPIKTIFSKLTRTDLLLHKV